MTHELPPFVLSFFNLFLDRGKNIYFLIVLPFSINKNRDIIYENFRIRFDAALRECKLCVVGVDF